MANGSLRELYLDELDDLYDSETQMLLTLPRLAEAAHSQALKETLRRQCIEAQCHLERLELIFTHWGEPRRGRRCAGLAAIVQEADDRVNAPTTLPARDLTIIGVAHRITHYEIAAYGTARLYARWLNRLDDARLIEETLIDEDRADRRLTEIAEAQIEASQPAA